MHNRSYGGVMLQMRLEGDEAEARAFLAVLAGAGAEVQVGTVKARREGFSHVYAVVRMPGYAAPPAGPAGPVRGEIVVDRPAVDGGRRALRGRREVRR
jgi:hypothetical protein